MHIWLLPLNINHGSYLVARLAYFLFLLSCDVFLLSCNFGVSLSQYEAEWDHI